MIKNNGYKFLLRKRVDNLEDYEIWLEDKKIGDLLLTLHEDYIFIRHIGICDEYRRCGHATKVIDGLKANYKKAIHLCVSINSTSAVSFWKNYFTKNNVENIRGHIYSIVP